MRPKDSKHLLGKSFKTLEAERRSLSNQSVLNACWGPSSKTATYWWQFKCTWKLNHWNFCYISSICELGFPGPASQIMYLYSLHITNIERTTILVHLFLINLHKAVIACKWLWATHTYVSRGASFVMRMIRSVIMCISNIHSCCSWAWSKTVWESYSTSNRQTALWMK